MEERVGTEGTNYPWLVFRLAGKAYAVNSVAVSNIMMMPTDVEAIPDAPANIRGIFTLRGAVIPLLDLRGELGLTTLSQESGEFVDMLEARKEDHIRWVEELERCIGTGEPFTLATDPHQCALGRWYDHYRSAHDSVNHHLRKLDGPHRRLHGAAADVMGCDQQHDACKREVCLKQVLKKVRDEYCPRILDLLEETKEIYTSTLREMVVVLDDGERSLGIAVDEVLAVRDLSAVTDEEGLGHFGRLSFVSGVSRMEEGGELILLLEPTVLLGMVEGLPVS